MQHLDPRDDRSFLKDILTRKSLKLDRTFQLSSGATSDRYIDGKLTTCSPEAMPSVGRVFLRRMSDNGWSPTAVGGLTVGADPIAFSVARESLEALARPIQAFIVRKSPKAHGMKHFIEGIEETETSGLPVVILDDVCTQGTSTGDAIKRAREAGMHVLGAICLVDRQEGATKFLADTYQCRLDHIFTLDELVAHYRQHERTSEPIGAHS